MSSKSVWIVDDDQSIRWVLEKALGKARLNPRAFEDAASALEALEKEQPDALLTDIRMPGMSGLELLDRLQQDHPGLPVIVMTAHSDLDSAVTSYQGGAFEYLPKPFDINEAIALARRACETRASLTPEETILNGAKTRILGESPAMQEVFRAIGRLSQTHINVLINGESGTGKELVAKALHEHSPRRSAPFIALNTAAIPRDLLESELFGHEKGAFTGAHSQRIGRFEQADGGTLFLDEIGDMPAELQTRLLRVLAEGVFYRVGGRHPIRVDTRIIAATHQNLEERVLEGKFREDLFYRLNVIRIHIPALRERREDIPLLARHFLKQIAAELNEKPKTISEEAMTRLSQAHWPGNVRQLENACRYLMIMAAGNEILPSDLPAEISQEQLQGSAGSWQKQLREQVRQKLLRGEEGVYKDTLPEVETILVETALEHTGNKRQAAARLLGLGRNTLTRKIKELGISDEED